MGFQSGVNQAIGTIGAMASVKKVVEGQQEGLAKQEESNKIAKENTEQLEQQNTLLAIDEADKINKEYLQNIDAYNNSEKELKQLSEDITNTTNKKSKLKANSKSQVKYQTALNEMYDRMESISNTRTQLENRQNSLRERANIINKQTGGKLKDYSFLGTAKEWEERYGKE